MTDRKRIHTGDIKKTYLRITFSKTFLLRNNSWLLFKDEIQAGTIDRIRICEKGKTIHYDCLLIEVIHALHTYISYY